jgi:hypothetical protein
MPPMRLTDSEKELMLELAQPIPVERRGDFLEAVATRLGTASEVGPGLTHRIGRELQRSYFDPPRDLRSDTRR